jgi:hypothetical protein
MSCPCSTARLPEKETCSTSSTSFPDLAVLGDHEAAVLDGELPPAMK